MHAILLEHFQLSWKNVRGAAYDGGLPHCVYNPELQGWLAVQPEFLQPSQQVARTVCSQR